MKMGFVLKEIETGETLDYNPADFSALLRVARAAKKWLKHYNNHDVYDKEIWKMQLMDALKEVEHLLEVDDETE